MLILLIFNFMLNLYNYSRKKLSEILDEKYGKKPFCATQLFEWIYSKKISSFDEITNISKKFLDILKKDFYIAKNKYIKKIESQDGAIKLLIELVDKNLIETVILPYKYGYVLCVSSQVGCNMGCSFCASGLTKKKRNLETCEIVNELLIANDILSQKNEKISHIVVMGIGEPFDNYDNVMNFIYIANDPKGFGIGARHITVSTCGLPEKIKKYANEKLQINLAISLHAPNDDKRSSIMKINKCYPLKKLMNAIRYYNHVAKRRVTFEYILLKDVNDSFDDAKELSTLIKGVFSYVNIIPYNEVMENNFKRSDKTQIRKFFNWLIKFGVHVRIRKEFGNDINAACGQLRLKKMKSDEKISY